MERFLMHDLKAWKDNASRKPLIINGARQVGKTWLIKEFGRLHYASVAYVNMDNNAPMRDLFNAGYDIDTLLAGIQLQTGTTIDPATTLIVFDEVQENPKALTALKYFDEDPRSFSIIAAGSLLGILLQSGTGFPVGKVETLNLYPLSFQEFALASEGATFVNALQSSDLSLIQAFKSRAIALLKSYYFVGGMPEAVDAFLASGDYQAARTVQRRILADYERDFSKHIPPREAERVFAVWNSIVAHLSQENKKFIFGRLAKGGRAKDFESALTWLRQAGIIYQVPRVTKPGIPLKAYRDAVAFKAFLLDVGLLGAMSDVDSDSILNGNSLFEEFKGGPYRAVRPSRTRGILPPFPLVLVGGEFAGRAGFPRSKQGEHFRYRGKGGRELARQKPTQLQGKVPRCSRPPLLLVGLSRTGMADERAPLPDGKRCAMAKLNPMPLASGSI